MVIKKVWDRIRIYINIKLYLKLKFKLFSFENFSEVNLYTKSSSSSGAFNNFGLEGVTKGDMK